MTEKEVVSRNVAIALGTICIILVASLIGSVAYYTSRIDALNYDLASYVSEISDLNSTIISQKSMLNESYNDLLFHINQIANATNYISNFMFVPNIGLDREAPIAAPNTIWLTNDNYIVYVVLSKLNIGRAGTIKQKLDSYGITGNGKVELFNDKQVGIFRASNIYTLGTLNGYTIKEEVLNGSVMNDFDQYADLCFLWSKNLLLKGDIQGARTYFNEGMSYWNGTGFLDKAFNASTPKEFDTFKVGLALWMARQLNQTTNGQIRMPDFTKMENIIWTMQNSTNGGIYTNYTSTFGNAGSDTNVETTAICLLYILIGV